MTKAVTKNADGTIVEAEGNSAPEAEAKTPASESKVSPKVEEDPKLYSQKDFDAASQIFKSEEGRLRKEAEDERDEAKSRILEIETDVEDIQAERDTLQTQIEELTSEDPKKFDLIKRDKELREAQRTLKTATAELATERKASEERVKVANETLLEIAVWDVATEYKGGDPVKLKSLCATLGITDEAKLREVAGNLWEKAEAKAPAKKGEGDEKEKLILDSGGGSGGKGEISEEERARARYPKRFPPK